MGELLQIQLRFAIHKMNLNLFDEQLFIKSRQAASVVKGEDLRISLLYFRNIKLGCLVEYLIVWCGIVKKFQWL